MSMSQKDAIGELAIKAANAHVTEYGESEKIDDISDQMHTQIAIESLLSREMTDDEKETFVKKYNDQVDVLN
jgi:hypothetical protein